ncbi:MAG: tail fiber domain-containing protein, partial [Saprospiraceae bacterium]|nr:tail fiber domain-containing protein [Saprospiraceae bacterium]
VGGPARIGEAVPEDAARKRTGGGAVLLENGRDQVDHLHVVVRADVALGVGRHDAHAQDGRVVVVGDAFGSSGYLMGKDSLNRAYSIFNANDNYVYFGTVNGGTEHENTLVLRDGNVGIGATDPGENLVVGVDIGSFSGSRITIADTTGFPGLNIGESNNDRAFQLFNRTNSYLYFGTLNGGVIYNNTLVLRDGEVGIGTSSPSYKLDVNGDINAQGAVRCNGTNICSDLRYKHSIVPIENALDKLQSINGVYYNWDTDQFPDKNFKVARDVGVIAQEMESVFPELISEDDEGYKAVDYAKFSAVLLEAVKEQQQQISTLQSQINDLQKVLQSDPPGSE